MQKSYGNKWKLVRDVVNNGAIFSCDRKISNIMYFYRQIDKKNLITGRDFKEIQAITFRQHNSTGRWVNSQWWYYAYKSNGRSMKDYCDYIRGLYDRENVEVYGVLDKKESGTSYEPVAPVTEKPKLNQYTANTLVDTLPNEGYMHIHYLDFGKRLIEVIRAFGVNYESFLYYSKHPSETRTYTFSESSRVILNEKEYIDSIDSANRDGRTLYPLENNNSKTESKFGMLEI